MNTKISKSKALELIDEKLRAFRKMRRLATYKNRYDMKYKETYGGAEAILKELFGQEEANSFRIKVAGVHVAVLGGEIDYEREIEKYKGHIDKCVAQLNVYRERIVNFWTDDADSKPLEKNRITESNSIFVVHGHNELMKNEVTSFLRRNKLDVVVLHEKPNKGRTIIEKFEAYSQVGAAVIIISADDEMRLGHKSIFRPRQNVILEMGFFIGKLGRDKVIAIYQDNHDKEIEILSDYKGVLYIPFDINTRWKHELANELREIGYKIDMNKI